jgi:arabinogalactan endo-1,4-beta-galactosidase
MDNFSKIAIARYFLSLGLLLQFLFMIHSQSSKINSFAFIIMGISAFYIFSLETEGKKYFDTHGISRIINIFLFLAISIFAYKNK